jgi:hypothetical protein
MCVGVRDFSLYLRPRQNGRPVYYARFRDDSGAWTSGRSTGQTVRALAEGWATAEVKRRREEAEREEQERQAGITLAAFAGTDFFSYDGRWALDRRASAKRLSPRQCGEKRQTFEKRVLPVLGQRKPHQINRGALKACEAESERCPLEDLPAENIPRKDWAGVPFLPTGAQLR